MGQRREMSFVERLPIPAIGLPALPKSDETNRRFEIVVVYTSVQATIMALTRAVALAKGLNARLRLVMLNVIPYPLPLERPPVRCDFSERRLLDIASASPVETTVQLCMCRQRFETLVALLRPRSLVVIGGHKTWWPTKEEKLARELRRAGHEVILAESTNLVRSIFSAVFRRSAS
jgi:hypothetical protein